MILEWDDELDLAHLQLMLDIEFEVDLVADVLGLAVKDGKEFTSFSGSPFESCPATSTGFSLSTLQVTPTISGATG